MKRIVISPSIVDKRNHRHGVGEVEVRQCFNNRTGRLLTDTREKHRTDPPTQWFIALTNKARLPKICFVPDGDIDIRTAYEPNDVELEIYRRHGCPHDF
ncbi:MAG: DUF4258 domain-containing protein [Xanthomonadales bacterium]|nr:DUF4258 domain-containing protein [Xanthomonadales bacterium]